MTPEELKAAMQDQLMKHFNNDVAKAKKFIKDCKSIGLDITDPEVIQNIADKTPVFMNLLTHELWGTLSTFARVVDELNKK